MKKLYVLDTCVLLNDPDALFNMDEHDVGLCFEVLNELDRIKDSKRNAAYEARQVIRSLHSLMGELSIDDIRKGVPLGDKFGSLFLLEHKNESTDSLTGDNAIINSVVLAEKEMANHKVVLVTRDMNMNIRAKLSGVQHVEDYRSDRVDNIEALDDTGFASLSQSVWDYFSDVSNTGADYKCVLKEPVSAERFVINRYIEDGDLLYRIVSINEGIVTLRLITEKKVFGLSPRNVRQKAAFDAVTDPEIGLVTLCGMAGSGKTLVAVAAALQAVIEEKLYEQIILVRNTPPISEDIGFLTGDEEAKMRPFFEGVLDSLSCLGAGSNKNTTEYLIDASSMRFKSVNTMRGASCQNTLMIIEEAQNTNINTVKALITRIGVGSKVILTGNLVNSQIDSSYCTAVSNGHARTIEVYTGHPGAAHVQLVGSQRGDIAAHAEEFL